MSNILKVGDIVRGHSRYGVTNEDSILRIVNIYNNIVSAELIDHKDNFLRCNIGIVYSNLNGDFLLPVKEYDLLTYYKQEKAPGLKEKEILYAVEKPMGWKAPLSKMPKMSDADMIAIGII